MLTAPQRFHRDQRGAVMLIGLCMSCFLIGGLWFLMGIGDAIVFRDSMQEVADHAVFTSAVLHAKGMNFISAVNLIMLAFIFFHILLGLVNDILFLLCLIPFVDIVACPLFVDEHEVYVNYGNDVMKPACTALHYAELVAAYGYPWLGSIRGYTLGSDYGKMLPRKPDLKVLVLSPSLIPGTGLDAAMNSLFKEGSGLRRATSTSGAPAGQKKGLPVQGKAYNVICAKIGKLGVKALLGVMGDIPLKDLLGKVLGKILGTVVQFRYCNSLGFQGSYTDLTLATRPDIPGQLGKVNDSIDRANKEIADKNASLPKGATPQSSIDTKLDTGTGGGLSSLDPGMDQWWGHEGPMLPWSGTNNGSPWQEVWSINLNPSYSDAQEHAVALGQRRTGQRSTVKTAFGYFSEAEFYFDCKKKWDDDECDGDDNAGYSVQWRARLKRLELPEVGELLGTYIGSFIANLDGVWGAVKELRWFLNALPIGPLAKLVGPVVNGAFGWLQGNIVGAGDALGKHLTLPAIKGAYH